MKTLQVTSPPMKGKDVKSAQSALAKSKYGSFYHGELDGEYGPISGNAAKDAKYYLGYESKNVNSSYGDSLHKFLTGKAQLTDAMKKRRQDRLREPPIGKKREKMLSIARGHIGKKESPAGSNKVPEFSGWYGVVGPWCAMFVTRCGADAGLSAFIRGSRWAYCPYMVSDAQAGRNGLVKVASSSVEPGDIVLFDWGGDNVADHVGLFERWTGSSTFNAIEGNTSVDNDSNGGEVMRRSRSTGDVCLFARATR